MAYLPTAILCQDYNLKVRSYAEYAALMKVSSTLAPDTRYHPYPIDDLPICMNYPTTNPPHALKYTGDAPLLLGKLAARPGHAVDLVGQRRPPARLQGGAAHVRGLGPPHLRQGQVPDGHLRRVFDLAEGARARHALRPSARLRRRSSSRARSRPGRRTSSPGRPSGGYGIAPYPPVSRCSVHEMGTSSTVRRGPVNQWRADRAHHSAIPISTTPTAIGA
ncbi:hypothetical protein [Nonomuraea rubra]|uniref:hypothetical protein n=1 Tax=Nonomuraea rubra TaxID=46180 RepID=UPI0031E9C165